MRARPRLYKVICISIYEDELKELDAKVERMKAAGCNRANRSALIRAALSGFDGEDLKAAAERIDREKNRS